MYAVSDAFRTALLDSHRIASRAEVLQGGAVVRSLDVHAGGVEVDGTAAVRRRCSVELVDHTGALTPDQAGDVLTPYGNELRLFRGVVYPDGAEELVPLGVFLITDVAVRDKPEGVTLAVEGYDRARRVEGARFTSTTIVPAGINYAVAIRDLLRARVPTLEFLPADATGWSQQTTRTTPQLVFQEQADPWRAARDMAESIGRVLYFDAAGRVVMPTEPSVSTSPVAWAYVEGEDATILGLDNRWTREGVYNHVIVTGETTSATVPVRGEAYDSDPNSPTYIGGPFGDVPYFFASPLITTAGQAVEAATGILRRVSGSTELVSFPAVVNPAHEAGDVVAIVRAKSAVSDLYLLDRFNVPLGPGETMTASARRQR